MPEYKERAPGTYRATFVKLDTDYPIVDRQTGEETIRWRWVFQEVADPSSLGELDTISTPGFRARSNGLKLFTGMLGRAPREGDNTDSLIRGVFDVVYGPNQNGRNTVINAFKIVDAPARPATNNVRALAESAAAQKALQEGEETATFRGAEVPVTDPKADDLPF